ncbi:glycosyltransferase [Luteimonas mephitis]|uniref:glycosyltransferase n=1 Tax=Luteimonas mephitis TaxID=83615 RepID=UPI000413B095|nr:glycosyltransferase [Luteimonas mephitis]
MRITHFVENLARGGLERVVINLVQAQVEEGHECQVICLFEHGALAKELIDAGIPVMACRKRRGPDLLALARARRALAKSRCEVLHSHNDLAHYYAVAASRGLGISRIVNTRHGMPATAKSSRRAWLYRKAMRFTDTVVAVGETVRGFFVGLGIEPRRGIVSIPNGIHVQEFSPANADAHARLTAELGLPGTTRLLGNVGRLSPVKNQTSLLRAFSMVRASIPESALLVVGDGELRAELEALAASEGLADAVFFLGARGDVARLLEALDLFVLSSLSEGYSMALLEACAAGLPIVATDVGGNAEIVRAGVNGLLVPPAEPEAMAAAIRDLLRTPVRAAQFGRAGREWVLEEGSFRMMAERYARIYAA